MRGWVALVLLLRHISVSGDNILYIDIWYIIIFTITHLTKNNRKCFITSWTISENMSKWKTLAYHSGILKEIWLSHIGMYTWSKMLHSPALGTSMLHSTPTLWSTSRYSLVLGLSRLGPRDLRFNRWMLQGKQSSWSGRKWTPRDRRGSLLPIEDRNIGGFSRERLSCWTRREGKAVRGRTSCNTKKSSMYCTCASRQFV